MRVVDEHARLDVDVSTPVDECVARTEAWVEANVPVAWREAAARGGNAAIREVRGRADYEAWYPVFGASGLVMPTWAPEYGGLGVAPETAGAMRAVLAPYASGSASAAALFASSWQGEGDSFGWEEDWARARVAHEQAERFVTALPPALREAEPVLKARSANLRLLGEAYHKSAMADAARDSSNRAGLIACGGVGPALASLRMKRALEREQVELVRFAASERYFQLRSSR